LALERAGGAYVCAKRHSFDVARSGYVNLLQPQERRAKEPGDSKRAALGRRAIHEAGHTREILAAVGEIAQFAREDRVADAGCGEGFYLGRWQEEVGFAACGIDISSSAIELAARRYPACTWVVANADRALPLADGSVTKLLSITARRNVKEYARVLGARGMLLLAVPSPEDLKEIRGEGRDRSAQVEKEFNGDFALVETRRVTSRAELTAAHVEDLLWSIYRPRRAEAAREMTVTFSLDFLLFGKKGH
jgi:23S rRNA (guanine745-N1)-methyltransferase